MTTGSDPNALYERVQQELNKYIGGMQDECFNRHDLALLQSAFLYGMKVGILLPTEHTKALSEALDKHADNFFRTFSKPL